MNGKTTRTRALAERAYARLKDRILRHELRPGQRLQDRDLARDLGVSRTPTREALNRLERDGLVRNRDGKGYFVRDIDPQEIEHLYDLRELIECHAMRLAVKHATTEDTDELAEILDAIDAVGESAGGRAEQVQLGIRIHEIVARASGNPFLHDIMVRVLEQLLFFIWTEAWLETPEEIEQTRREHRAYLTVLRARSTGEATALVRTHVQRAKSQFLRMSRTREEFYAQRESPGPRDAKRSSHHHTGAGRSTARSLS